MKTAPARDQVSKPDQIIDAVLALLARDGLDGVTMRSVAREAGVAVGLMNYHFEDKRSLIAAALERIGDQDAQLVAPAPGSDAAEAVRLALRRVVASDVLHVEYLSQRLQLWSLAPTDDLYAAINRRAQRRYRDGLADLIGAARPDLDVAEVARRAGDILVIQNGVWLTSVLIEDPDAIERSLQRCEEIALG